MKIQIQKGVIGILLGAFVFAGAVGRVYADTGDTYAAAVSGMKKVAESDSLELYFDEAGAGIAVVDKSSGEIWFSNPADTEKDTVSSGYYQRVLKSQVNITYINKSTQVSTMNSYSDAVAEGQYTVAYLENGVRVTYTMGEGGSTLLLPEVIAEERMLLFQEKMSDDQKRKLNRNYSLDEENGLYTLRGGVKDYLKEELAEYFAEAGYTETDYELDSQNGGSGGTQKEWFTIPVTYELDGDELLVWIDPAEVAYDTEDYYLVEIDLLRYFGASMSDEGYLFVPDGSGALIDFNNGKTTASSYKASVYGQDATMLCMNWKQSQVDPANTVRMPVYGIKEGQKALFAIIEEGDAYAFVNAEVSGKTTGYNDVYPSFTYLQYGEASLDDIVGANSYYMYSEPEFSGRYAVRYSFLTGDAADYSGMAECYRDHLIEKGVLGEKTEETAVPFYAEYIGAVDKEKTFFGVKYDAIEAVTTFDNAKEITGQLEEQGVENINIVYSGWMNGGLRGTAATKLSVVSGLKEKGYGLGDFLEDREKGDTYFTADFQYVYRDKLFDGYSTMRYAPKYFDNTNVTVNQYGLANRESAGRLANLISPRYTEKIVSDFTGMLAKKGITGIHLGTLSYELYSDLQRSDYTDRQMAEEKAKAAAEGAAQSGFSLLGDNANAYLWGCLEEEINLPFFSNGYQILDREVPFYGMVLHGYIPFAGEALNLSDDYETAVLKSVENGAGLHFRWIYADNSVLKETDYSELYSVNYGAWLDMAAETWKRINRELGGLQNLVITEHTYMTDDMVKVTYENGTRVYINYGNEAAEAEGVLVGARDYKVIPAGKE
ncbi:MAG: DUF5696 domain-containing protein [Firmicutes bacterium]|nr:DUF5696 domain-containing protein [Bacillota bacterium]